MIELTQQQEQPAFEDICISGNDIKIRKLGLDDLWQSLKQGYEDFGELMNLTKDPLEINNLWDDKDSKELKVELLNKLIHEVLNLQSRLPEKQALT